MSASNRRRPWFATLAVLLIGLAATTASALGFRDSDQRDQSRRFDAAAERARGAIADRLQLQLENLTHLRNWMLLDPGATRADFERVTSLGFADGLYPRVQALSYSPRVPAANKAAFQAAQQGELANDRGFPSFTIHPTTTSDAYPVTYLEPLEGNQAALGFDLASDPARKTAIEDARDRGHSVGTPPVRLIQESGDQAGFVLLAPVYDSGDVPVTAPARRRHFVGVISAVFRVGDMFTGVLGTDPEVDAEIYDIGPTVDFVRSATPRLDSSTLLLNTRPTPAVRRDGTVDGPHRNLDLSIGDRRWRLVLTPSAGFTHASEALPLTVAVLGTLITLLLAGMVQRAGSARQRAQQRALEMTADLRAAQERARSIIHGAPDAMLVVDGSGRISMVNEATEALFGHPAADLEGQTVETLLPRDLTEVHRLHRAAYAAEPRRREMGADLELLGRRADGATFPVEISLSPLVGPGDTVEVIAAVRDVSERRAAQAALQDAYDHEREAAEQLRQADELKTSFLNTITHELRTPLTAITGFTNVLLGTPVSSEQREDYLRRIQRNAESLTALIGDVLAFARLDRHDRPLMPERLDLAVEVPLIVDHLAPILKDHAVQVRADKATTSHVDREALTRILTNLLTNAVRYSPAGTTITVDVGHTDGQAVLSVEDEGPGIPPDERRQVFERFYRGATALVSGTPGTGIGLAVVRELTHRSGGTVSVVDGEGGGARLEVTLPAGAPG